MLSLLLNDDDDDNDAAADDDNSDNDDDDDSDSCGCILTQFDQKLVLLPLCLFLRHSIT